MPDVRKNFVYSTVATAPSPAQTGTTLSVQAGDASYFPDPAVDGAYNLTVWPTGVIADRTNAEIVRATAKTGAQLTITRGQEGSTARSIVVGDQIALTITKKTLDDLDIVPGARVFHSVAQAITDATDTVLAFDSERFDTDTIHDTAVNNSRLTCKTAGKYRITGNIEWAASTAGGYRRCYIRLNGTTSIAVVQQPPPSAAGIETIQNVGCEYNLAVNDYVELIVKHNAGANLNANASAQYSPEFAMMRLSG